MRIDMFRMLIATVVVIVTITAAQADEVPKGNSTNDEDVLSLIKNNNRLYCLALNDYHEARNQNLVARIAVMKVILNRVRSDLFPNDVCSVITAGGSYPPNRCQFSWYCDGKSDFPKNQSAWIDSIITAEAFLASEQFIYDPTHGSVHFHSTFLKNRPKWTKAPSIVEATVIGDHVFYSRDDHNIKLTHYDLTKQNASSYSLEAIQRNGF